MDKGIVDAQAAVLAQQLVRVGVDLGGGVLLHLDVRRQPVAVLAFGAAVLDFCIVGHGSVAVVNVQRLPMCVTGTVTSWPSESSEAMTTGRGTKVPLDTATPPGHLQ